MASPMFAGKNYLNHYSKSDSEDELGISVFRLLRQILGFEWLHCHCSYWNIWSRTGFFPIFKAPFSFIQIMINSLFDTWSGRDLRGISFRRKSITSILRTWDLYLSLCHTSYPLEKWCWITPTPAPAPPSTFPGSRSAKGKTMNTYAAAVARATEVFSLKKLMIINDGNMSRYSGSALSAIKPEAIGQLDVT